VTRARSGSDEAERHGDPAESGRLERVRQGSRADFDVLVARHAESLFGFLRLRGATREDAEELCQEAFLRAWQRIELYDPRWSFSTWLYTIARRRAVSRRRRPALGLVGSEFLAEVAGDEDPTRAAVRGEERRGIWGLADRVLTREQRSALWLRYGEDLSAEEIGRALGRGAASVRLLLFRARRRLARHLDGLDASCGNAESAIVPAALAGELKS
jgi:RNA polymerase sigma-70 factor (ECF subfamily)